MAVWGRRYLGRPPGQTPPEDTPRQTPPAPLYAGIHPTPLHAGIHPSLWTEGMTNACENITFQLLLRAVTMRLWWTDSIPLSAISFLLTRYFRKYGKERVWNIWVFPKCSHRIRWIQWQKILHLKKMIRTSNLLCKWPRLHHSNSKEQATDKILKLTPTHSSVIYQIPWIHWISLLFRENSIAVPHRQKVLINNIHYTRVLDILNPPLCIINWTTIR